MSEGVNGLNSRPYTMSTPAKVLVSSSVMAAFVAVIFGINGSLHPEGIVNPTIAFSVAGGSAALAISTFVVDYGLYKKAEAHRANGGGGFKAQEPAVEAFQFPTQDAAGTLSRLKDSPNCQKIISWAEHSLSPQQKQKVQRLLYHLFNKSGYPEPGVFFNGNQILSEIANKKNITRQEAYKEYSNFYQRLETRLIGTVDAIEGLVDKRQAGAKAALLGCFQGASNIPTLRARLVQLPVFRRDVA